MSATTSNIYEVFVLKEGYSCAKGAYQVKAAASITLLKGPHIVLVETGNPWDKDLILEGLTTHGLTPDSVDFVVCTHGHSDHIGNLNLFSKATQIVAYDICVGDRYLLHDFKEGIPYEIDDYVRVIATPGHTSADVSIVVKNTDKGVVVIAGDLFEREEDLEDPQIWQDNSEEPEVQEQSRINVLKVADFIVPGHGPMFKVPPEYKRQMRVLMVCEVFTYSDCGHSCSHYSFIEEY